MNRKKLLLVYSIQSDGLIELRVAGKHARVALIIYPFHGKFNIVFDVI